MSTFGPIDHIDAATVYELVDGRLPPIESRRIEDHLRRCDACRALREECGALRSVLGWYAADPPPPPAGYWEEFWDRWTFPHRKVVSRETVRRFAPAALLAASVALLIGVWRPGGERPGELPPPVRSTVVAQTEWSEEYDFFERVTVAVGSVDPMSKGVVLASLAEAP